MTQPVQISGEAKINLRLTVNTVNAILSTLGKLPTESGAYPIMIDIKTQADAEVERLQAAAIPKEKGQKKDVTAKNAGVGDSKDTPSTSPTKD